MPAPFLRLFLGSFLFSLFVLSSNVLFCQKEITAQSTAAGLLEQFTRQLNSTTDLESKANLYSDIGFTLKMLGKFDEGLSYVDSGMSLSKKIGFEEGILRAHDHYSSILYEKGEFDKSLFHRRKQLMFLKHSGDTLEVGPVLYHIGLSLQELGLNRSALDTLTIAILALREENKWTQIGSAYNLLASIHSVLGQRQEALEVLDKALVLSENKLGMRQRTLILTSKADILMSIGEFEEANALLKEAQKKCETHGFIHEAVSVAQSLAALDLSMGNYVSAIEKLDNCLSVAIDLGMKKVLLPNCLMKSVALESLGKKDEALIVAQQGLKYVDSHTIPSQKSDLFSKLSSLFYSQHNTDSALHFLLAKNRIDSIMRQRSSLDDTRHLEVQFRTKEQKIQLLQQEKDIDQKSIELKRSAENLRLISIGLIASLLLLTAGYFWFKLRQRNLIQAKEIELNSALIESTEEERERIARELHDGAGSLLTGIKLGLEQMKENGVQIGNEDKLTSQINAVQEVAKELRRVSHAMAPSAIDRLAFADVLNDLIITFRQIGTATINKVFSSELESLNKTERLMLYRILQECLNNSFKHSKATEIHISITIENEKVEMLYEDNGRGFEKEKSTSGIGLDSIRKRIEYLNGNQTLESSSGQGMLLILDFPILRAR